MKIVLAGGWRSQFELRLKQIAKNQNLLPIFVTLRNLVWAAVAVRNLLNPQEQYRAPIPVISVGNITVGGTGKTPFVKWLMQRLIGIGCQPAILTPLSESADEVKEHASEGMSISGVYLVFPGRNRVASAKRAIEFGATVIVLDDGFQYRRLHRDVDIVLWDATSLLSTSNPFLREPLSSLKRANCIVISKADALSDKEREMLKQQIEKWSGQRKVISAFGYEPKLVVNDESLEGRNFGASRILLVAGIANPHYFSLTAKLTGLKAVGMVCFPDHHRYSLSDAKFICDIAKSEGADAVLTTRKDAVKLRKLWQSEIPLLVLKVKLRWLWGEEKIWEIVERSVHCKVHH